MINLYFKAFIRDRLLCILLLFLFGVHVYYFVYVERTLIATSHLYYVLNWLRLAPVSYSIFMLISFGYGSRIKQAQLEGLSVYPCRTLKHFLFQFILLSAWVLLTFLLVTAFYVVRLSSFTFFHPEFLSHVLKVTFLFYFLLPTLGVVVSLCVSRIKNRLMGYALLFLTLVISSPATHNFMLALYRGTNPRVHAVINLFKVWPETNWINENYGIPAEPILMWTFLFWIVVFTVIFVLRLLQRGRAKNKGMIAFLGLVLMLPVGWMALSPASRMMTFSESLLYGGGADQFYYRIYEAEQFEEPSDLVVTRMQIQLRIRNDLRANVKLQYSGASERGQSFTLYHGYHVDSVKTEGGKDVRFERKNDVIELRDDIADEGTLEFTYHGSGNRYYANQQGIFLPAHHAFFPIPGKHRLWLEEAGGLVPVIRETPMEIMLEVDYKGDLISSLPKVSEHIFHGYAESFTLMSGFYEVFSENQVSYVIPYLNTDAHDQMNMYKQLRKQPNNAPWKEKLDQATFVAMIPNINQTGRYETIYISSSQVLFKGFHDLEGSGANYDILPYKSPLMNLLVGFTELKTIYEGNLSIARQNCERFPNEIHDLDSMYLRFEALRDHYTDQELEHRVRQFLLDNQDTRTITDLLSALESQTEEENG